ncbi:hypothetical protein GMLC_32380 [Geomonas limicola]|uniref:Fibronectin type-III domain-containing protein n=1 Tax=Geomonas limicola TaxID=2740186 RepID=A0A6V8NEW4_9BACT|nr:fibronectin type III domain-containing protein [Geomonas limicola]GFO69659.1 hypothetical protein GMLC_32380 [Geomonas limicola]
MGKSSWYGNLTVLTRLAYLALFIIGITTATLSFGAGSAQAAQVALSWSTPATYSDGTPLTTLRGYKLYTGTASGSYGTGVDLGNVNSYTLTGLNDGTTYYFAVTAYSSAGDVSGYSNQVSYSTPAAATQNSTCTVTASAGTGGSISPTGTTVLSGGVSQSYTVTPNAGYYVASVTVDGAAVVKNIVGGLGYSYTFTNLAASHTIAASFAVRSYHLVSTAGTGGSVTPADAWVQYQGSQAIAITPATGYQVADVQVDGKSAGAVSSYTFSSLNADHTLNATFAQGYTITASAGSNGSITPAGATAASAGSSKTYTITPNTGYYVSSVVVDGTTVASNIPSGGYSYTFSNLAGNHTISATFGIRYYNIVATAGTGGTITPGNTWALYNSSQTVTITPASGKKIASVTVDGVSVGAVPSYTFTNISQGHTVQASFL